MRRGERFGARGMSRRASPDVPTARTASPSRLTHVLAVGHLTSKRSSALRPVPNPADELAVLLARLGVEPTDVNTGKRRVDGSRAAARVGQTVTEKWANERFRQVMLLVLEFRREWPGSSLLSADDVEAIRTAVDNALFAATQEAHSGDIYDMNAT
eukprot:7376821-Prymnesium_polylepis.1